MVRRLLFFTAFLSILGVAPAVPASDDQVPGDFVPGQVIIKLAPFVAPTDASSVQETVNAVVVRRFDSIGAELWKIEGIDVAAAVAMYKNDPRVAYIEPDYVVRAESVFPNDPRFSTLWALHNTGQTGGTPDADIDAPEAWSIQTGNSVLVGIIDSGVDWHHADLAGNIFTNIGEVPGNGIDDDGNGYVDDVRGWDFYNNDNDPFDDNGHGTHLAGTIAAVGNNGIGVVGVSWSARILPVKFLSSSGSGSISNAILAIEYAATMGAKLTNNSWGGGGYSVALRDAIEAAGVAGSLFVATAGGSGSNNDVRPEYPASYDLDNIVAVSCTGQNDELSSFSNYGPTSVDLGAPGVNIYSTRPGNSYTTMSGTSMATAQVSGALCLLWAAAPGMTRVDAKSAVMSSVDPVPALVGKVATGGRLNVYSMLRVAITRRVAVDIRPGACPNSLNVKVFEKIPKDGEPKQGGVLPVAVLGAEDLIVNDIDVSSLLLNGVAPLRHEYEDVSAPPSGAEDCECWTAGPDGRVDLTLKFQTSEVVGALGAVTKGDVVPLRLTGWLLDGTPVEGTDCVKIVIGEIDDGDLLGAETVLLGPAAPNPFNPCTRIPFTLAEKTRATLSIYDVRGRWVRTLIDETVGEGHHERDWNGRDANGNPVGSGVYFYRLTAGNRTTTKKMVLLK